MHKYAEIPGKKFEETEHKCLMFLPFCGCYVTQDIQSLEWVMCTEFNRIF